MSEGRVIMRKVIEQWREKPLSRLTVEEVTSRVSFPR
jgi:hypothetical protein